jgi:hypothetical protein
MILDWSISRVLEIADALLWRKGAEQFTDADNDGLDRARRLLRKRCFSFAFRVSASAPTLSLASKATMAQSEASILVHPENVGSEAAKSEVGM